MVQCSICGRHGHNARTCKHKGRSSSQAGRSADTHLDVQGVVQDAMEEPKIQKRKRVGAGSSMDGRNDPTDGLQMCPICLDDPMSVPIMQACSLDNTHVMCGKCWKKTGPGDRCPLCRADGPVQEIQNGARYPQTQYTSCRRCSQCALRLPHVVS